MALMTMATWKRLGPRLGVALVGVSLIVAACGPSTPSASTNPGTSAEPGQSSAGASTKTTLVLGTDISVVDSLDPHHANAFTNYLIMKGPYDNLVTVDPSDYSKPIPQLATSWEKSSDGRGWVFKLREGVKFVSGNPFTADDVKFSYDRLVNLKDIAAGFGENLDSIEVIDPLTVQINLKDPTLPFIMLTTMSSTYAILDSKLVKEQGGESGPGADTADTAAVYLDQTSAGTGPYQITSWERGARIVLERNANYWGGTTPFERLVIQGFSDTAAEVLALEAGDIDVAMNLNADQLNDIEGMAGISIQRIDSLDMMYWTLSENHPDSGALADARVREAVFRGVDYQSIIDGLLGGNGIRPAGFMPIGLGGMTEEFAKQNRYEYNPDAAKRLLTDAGYPNGFEFPLSYATFVFAGVPYDQVAAKIQSDLAKIGVTAKLNPMDATTFATDYRSGKTVSSLVDWTIDAVEPWAYAEPSVVRFALRMNWTPSEALLAQMTEASSETDPVKRDELFRAFEKELIKQHEVSSLFQPRYGWAIRDSVAGVKLTAAGWFIHLEALKPAQ